MIETKTRPPSNDPRLDGWSDYPCVIVTDDETGAFTIYPEAQFRADEIAAVSASVPIERARAGKLDALAALRWEKTQTMTYDGVVTPSSDVAVAYLTGAVVAIQTRVPPPTVNWKLGPGEFRTWDLAALVAFGQAMRDHIQACFDNEQTLATAIAVAQTSAEVMAIDLTTGWP